MESMTARLGLFEVIGFLFAGVVAIALIVVPLSCLPRDVYFPLIGWADVGLPATLATIPIAYLLGVLLSGFAMVYYNGWPLFSKIFPVPPTRPGSHPVWALVDERLARAGLHYAQLEANDRLELYMIAGSPVNDSLSDRVASLTRLCAATVLACLISGLMTTSVLIWSIVISSYKAVPFLIAWLISILVLLFVAHTQATSYGRSFWRNVAAVILSVPNEVGMSKRETAG